MHVKILFLVLFSRRKTIKKKEKENEITVSVMVFLNNFNKLLIFYE